MKRVVTGVVVVMVGVFLLTPYPEVYQVDLGVNAVHIYVRNIGGPGLLWVRAGLREILQRRPYPVYGPWEYVQDKVLFVLPGQIIRVDVKPIASWILKEILGKNYAVRITCKWPFWYNWIWSGYMRERPGCDLCE